MSNEEVPTWKAIARWGALAIGTLLWGSGVAAMYGDDYKLASGLYGIGIVIMAIDLFSLDHFRTYSIVTRISISAIFVLFLGAISAGWMQLRIADVVQDRKETKGYADSTALSPSAEPSSTKKVTPTATGKSFSSQTAAAAAKHPTQNTTINAVTNAPNSAAVGINNGTINIGSASRILSNSVLEQFKRELPALGTIWIIPAGIGEDVAPLSQQLCNAATGIVKAVNCHEPVSPPSVQNIQGVKCYWGYWQTDAGKTLKKALDDTGLSPEYIDAPFVDGGLTIGDPVILVGGRLDSATANPAVGNTGVTVERGGELEMKDSQVNNYANGVVDAGKAKIEHSQFDASGRTSLQPASPTTTNPATTPNCSNPGKLDNIAARGKQRDLARKFIPVGTESKLTLEEQRKITDAFADQWKQSNPGRAAEKEALLWINRQLQEQKYDFRMDVPSICPPDPNLLGVYMTRCATVENSEILGAGQTGIAVAGGANASVTNTEIKANDCD